jgi:hypothetical protein
MLFAEHSSDFGAVRARGHPRHRADRDLALPDGLEGLGDFFLMAAARTTEATPTPIAFATAAWEI